MVGETSGDFRRRVSDKNRGCRPKITKNYDMLRFMDVYSKYDNIVSSLTGKFLNRHRDGYVKVKPRVTRFNTFRVRKIFL